MGRFAKRYIMEADSKTVKTLKKMQAETGADSVEDVILDALKIYIYLIEEQKQGRVVIVKDPKTGAIQVMVPLAEQK